MTHFIPRPDAGRPTLALVAAIALIAGPSAARGQEEEYQAIPWSQRGAVVQRVGYTDISVTYNRPVARGRELFGGVVSWGRIWNPGADSATTIGVSADIEVEGRVLGAGRYTLWMIPAETGPWTVIFNRTVDIYHTPYPGEGSDALRLEIAPVRGAHMETLAFYFPEVVRENAVLRMHWGETVIPLRIATTFEP